MTSLIHTSHSTYEVNGDTHQIRRLVGHNAPTRNQGPDNEWKHYDEIVYVEGSHPGTEAFLIIWGMDGSILRRTVTSDIVSTEGDPVHFRTEPTIEDR